MMASGAAHASSNLTGAGRAGHGWRLWLPNLLAFQLCWIAAVLGASRDLPWLGVVAVAVSLAVHLLRAHRARRELSLAAAAAAIGFIYETIPYQLGWLAYPNHGGQWVPLWMIALWINFATVLNVSLRTLRTRPVLLALLGAVGGPAAYWGGAGLGAIEFVQTLPALLYLGLGWALLSPLLARIALRVDGYGPDEHDHGA